MGKAKTDKNDAPEAAPETHDYLLRIDAVLYRAVENVALKRRQDGNRSYSVRQLMTEIMERGAARTPEVRAEHKRLMEEAA